MAYWVQNDLGLKLATMAKPRGGDWLETDLEWLRREGADVLVSLLTNQETKELDLDGEQAACAAAGIRYEHFAIPDRDTPASQTEFCSFVERLCQEASKGTAVVAHCRAGIGRSSLLIAALLMRSGMSVDTAFDNISAARGLEVPDTHEQKQWLRIAMLPH